MKSSELVVPPTIPRWSPWLDGDRLERLTSLMVAASLIIGVISLIVGSSPLLGYLPIACSTVGWITGRTWRTPGLALILAAPLTAGLIGQSPVLTWSLSVPALFLFVLQGLSAVWVAPLGAIANYTAFSLFNGDPYSVIATVAQATSLAAAVTGAALNGRRRVREEMVERARNAEQARELEIQSRIAEERMRIARDLHDSVGHQMAVLNMHLGAAEVKLPKEEAADGVREQLRDARAAVQSVLAETQRILEILRVSPEETLAPTADFAHIPWLVESFRTAGLDIDADICDEPPGLGTEVSAACYRLVQEALTNAHKHGQGRVRLRVSCDRGNVSITVTNQVATSESGASSGFGLVGMRSRVKSVNGTLTAEANGRLFEVSAELPIHGGG